MLMNIKSLSKGRDLAPWPKNTAGTRYFAGGNNESSRWSGFQEGDQFLAAKEEKHNDARESVYENVQKQW